MLVRSWRSLAAVLLIALPACSFDGDDADQVGTAEGEKRIKVTGTEDLGEVQFGWPTGWSAGNTGFIGIGTGFSLRYRSQSMDIGAVERFTAGTGCVELYGAFNGALAACNVKVSKGYRTKYDLAALKVSWDPSSPSSTLAVDFGPQPELTVTRLAGGAEESDHVVWSRETTVSRYAQPVVGYVGALVLPGRYVIDYGVAAIPKKTFTLSQGEYERVAAMPADKRGKLLVKPPIRELPSVTRHPCVGENGTFVVQRSDGARTSRPEPDARDIASATRGGASGAGIREWRAIPESQSAVELTMFPLGPNDDSHYELVVNGVAVPFSVQAGKTETVSLERLDVDHVTVTRENGSTYTATGYYTVERRVGGAWVPLTQQQPASYGSCNASGDPVSFGASTGTGIDVPAGDYRVTISYSTGEGQREKVVSVSLP